MFPGLTLRDVYARALDVVGPSRLLFGTDSSFFPRGWQRGVHEQHLEVLTDLEALAGVKSDSARAPTSDVTSALGATTLPQVTMEDYAPVAIARARAIGARQSMAIVYAEGEIVDGNAGPGKIGGESMSKLIRQAREDDKIKAVVLRVNSPGGSAFASELVRRELELTRAVGKPVVVSMGGVAASGGYWISMASDEVIADPSTITGSIGVFGVLPTMPPPTMKKMKNSWFGTFPAGI